MIAVVGGILFALFLFFQSNVALAKSFSSMLCDSPQYACYTVSKGDTWQSLFPDEKERDVVMRINRTNMKLYKGQTLAIPTDSISDHLTHSPLPQQIDPPGTQFILVSLSQLAFGAYNASGTLVHWGPISGGRNYCSDVGRGCRTPSGKYAIYTKGGKGCASSKYPVGKGGAPMPYCMFFNKGYALHGSPKVPGYHDSHGCVRLFTNDAQWLNQEFTDGTYKVPVVINK